MHEYTCRGAHTECSDTGAKDEVNWEHTLFVLVSLFLNISIICINCQLAVVIGIARGDFLRPVELFGKEQPDELMREYEL